MTHFSRAKNSCWYPSNIQSSTHYERHVDELVKTSLNVLDGIKTFLFAFIQINISDTSGYDDMYSSRIYNGSEWCQILVQV